MRNPLRSEAEAFRFVIITIAAFAAIAAATALWGWVAGVIVFLVVTAAAFAFYYRQPAARGRCGRRPRRTLRTSIACS